MIDLITETVIVDVRTQEPVVYKDADGIDTQMTVRYVAGEALGANLECDKNISQEEKLKRGKLIEMLYSGPRVNLVTEEAALIKERIAKLYGPLIVVAVHKIFEKEN